MKDNTEARSRETGPAHQASTSSAPIASESQSSQGVVSASAGNAGMDSAKPVSADMQQFIGRQLRAVFDDVAKQPVPDRFLELMKQLDSKTEAR